MTSSLIDITTPINTSMAAMKIMMQRRHGFTLIEVLIVMVIIAIASGIIIIKVGNFYLSNKRSEVFAKEMKALIQLARNQAIFSMSTLGMEISMGEYAFYQLDDTNGKLLRWQPLGRNDAFWASRHIPDTLLVRYNVADNSKKNSPTTTGLSPQIIFSPSGEITPFSIVIHNIGRGKIYTITGTYAGQVDINESE